MEEEAFLAGPCQTLRELIKPSGSGWFSHRSFFPAKHLAPMPLDELAFRQTTFVARKKDRLPMAGEQQRTHGVVAVGLGGDCDSGDRVEGQGEDAVIE